MAMAVGGAKGVKSDINMTPMIDVLLVLIIIFMVITPLTPKGLEALVPQPPPPGHPVDASDQRAVVIVIDSKNRMTINSNESVDDGARSRGMTTEAYLGVRLEEIFKTRNERVVFVNGDPEIDFLWVAKAIDIAHGAGIDKVGLMTAKMMEGQ
jgi:biopolymer transport protein ExbD